MLVGAFEIHDACRGRRRACGGCRRGRGSARGPPARRRGWSRSRTRRRGCRRPSPSPRRSDEAFEEALAAPASYQASAPFSAKASAMRLLTRSSLRISTEPSPLLAHEHGDRHAPGALARDHPVGPALDHAGDAVLARRPAPSAVSLMARGAGAQRVARPAAPSASPRCRLVHRDEPLRRVAEDHRLLRAPGVRILMLEPAARDQHAGLDQRLDDGLVGVALLALVGDDALAGEARRLLGEARRSRRRCRGWSC